MGSPTTRKVLVSEELAQTWTARTDEGYRIGYEWGEPDGDGFYTPTVSVDTTDDLRAETLRDLRAGVLRLGRTDHGFVSRRLVLDLIDRLAEPNIEDTQLDLVDGTAYRVKENA